MGAKKQAPSELEPATPHISLTIIFLSIGIQIDRLDVTNEEDVKGIIKKYSTQSDTTKNINTVFNCAG